MLTNTLPSTEERKFPSKAKSTKGWGRAKNNNLSDIENLPIVENLLGIFNDAEIVFILFHKKKY